MPSGNRPYYVLDYFEGDQLAPPILARPTNPGAESLRMDIGVRVRQQVPILEFVKPADDQGTLLDYVNTMFRGLLISARFRAALEAANVDNIDYYAARIVDASTGDVRKDYVVANVIGTIECIDRGRSALVMAEDPPGFIDEIEELHLDYDRVHGRLFRLAEWFPIILVDSAVKQSLDLAALTGVRFVNAEGYAT